MEPTTDDDRLDPYVAPHSPVDDEPVMDAVAQRQAHVERELALRACGLPWFWFGAFVLREVARPALRGDRDGFLALLAGIGLALLLTGWGYLRLRSWVRYLMLPLSALAMAASFLTAAPLVIYMGWLTWRGTGPRVLADDYAAVRAATTSLPVWRQPFEALLVFVLFGLHVFLYRTLGV